MPQPLRIFDYAERQSGANRHAQAAMQDMGQFVTRQEFEALQVKAQYLHPYEEFERQCKELRRQIETVLKRNENVTYLKNALSYIAALERAMKK